jgi:hypothetical protein
MQLATKEFLAELHRRKAVSHCHDFRFLDVVIRNIRMIRTTPNTTNLVVMENIGFRLSVSHAY